MQPRKSSFAYKLLLSYLSCKPLLLCKQYDASLVGKFLAQIMTYFTQIIITRAIFCVMSLQNYDFFYANNYARNILRHVFAKKVEACCANYDALILHKLLRIIHLQARWQILKERIEQGEAARLPLQRFREGQVWRRSTCAG